MAVDQPDPLLVALARLLARQAARECLRDTDREISDPDEHSLRKEPRRG